MARPRQTVMAGFDQDQITTVEHWADEFDEKRDLIAGLKKEMDHAEYMLSQEMHANEAKVGHQKAPGSGGQILVYKRGDYNVKVKEGKEKVNVKIGQKSKGVAPEEAGKLV